MATHDRTRFDATLLRYKYRPGGYRCDRVRRFSGTRMCALDRFNVSDWFDWPWYRRWPWYWGGGWTSGMQCTLGKFQRVTADQVAEIEAVLRQP